MTGFIEQIQPALIALIEVLVAAIAAQVALWLRLKHKRDGVETRANLERDSALEAALFAEERARKMARDKRIEATPEAKLDIAQARLKKSRAQRKLPPIRAEEEREQIETAVGKLRSQVKVEAGELKASSQSIPPPNVEVSM